MATPEIVPTVSEGVTSSAPGTGMFRLVTRSPRRHLPPAWLIAVLATVGSVVVLAAPAAAPATAPGTFSDVADSVPPSSPVTSDNAPTSSSEPRRLGATSFGPAQVADTTVSVTQSITLDEIPVGGRTVVDLRITNTGSSPATGITLRNDLPSGLTHFSSSPVGTIDGNSITWTLGDLAAGASTDVELTLRATQVGVLTNRVSVSSDSTAEVADTAVVTVTSTGLNPQLDSSTTTTAAPTTTAPATESGEPASVDAGRAELARTGNSGNWLLAGALALLAVGATIVEMSTRLPAMATLWTPERRRRRLNRPVFHPVRSRSTR